MEFFLRAKHWQLFLIIYVIPVVLAILMMIAIFASIFQNDQPQPLEIFQYFRFIPLISLISMGGKLSWEWAVGIRLQRLAPAGLVFKSTAFKIFLLVVVVYYVALFVFIFSIVGSFFPIMESGQSAPGPAFFIGFACIMPLALAAMFGQFYSYYFAARTFKIAEEQRDRTFSDFVLECVLIWFFFVGVWILQPKINKMIEQEAIPQEVID